MKDTSKIYKTMVPIKTGFRLYDTIFWNDKYWIVPRWLENNTLGIRKPKRIILLDNIEHQIVPPGARHQFFVNETIPIYILHGHIPKETPYRVIEDPEIILEIPESQ